MYKVFLTLFVLGFLPIFSYEDSPQEEYGSGISSNAVTPSQILVQKELEMVRIDEKVGNVLDADITFYDLEGRAVSLQDYLGEKPLVLSFAYYSCSLICQFVLQGEVDVFNNMDIVPGKDFRALTISFDPEDDEDLTSRMTELYADQIQGWEGDPEWTFLYGEEEEIRDITGQLGFHYDLIEASGEYAHSAAIYVITPEGKISRYFYGILFDPFDLKLALIEAKDEKTRTTVERFLMFCYQYDAESRGYSLIAKRVMQVGGMATVVLIFLFVVFANHQRIRLIRKK